MVSSKDCFSREQDMEGLRNTPQDVSIRRYTKGGVQVALSFGIREQGESVKTTGALPNQGVIIEAPWVADLFAEHFRSVAPGSNVFRGTRMQVQRRVRQVCDQLGFDDHEDQLHRLRRTSPANDIFCSARRWTSAVAAADGFRCVISSATPKRRTSLRISRASRRSFCVTAKSF